MVIDSTWETVILNVISWLGGATKKINIIANIHMYKKLHEEHHFIPMAMEVHNALGHDMDHFMRECAHFFKK